ncbi:hypothetical protein ABFS82_05G039600 [Erythranthe guttata]|uniref:FAS1 domain-containing protein n=2 Tax=Erythranthe guttata TaxID=4155 RepID=A0A022QR53_ERYGU|nr:hypothetical protein MIMGU_mgv1a023677mg [Erythranthe guttata]
MASLKLLPPLILLLLSSAAAAVQPPPPQSITNAEDTLADSGYIAMSLILHAIAPTLPLPRPSATITTLTIFSPPDAAFYTYGQPSLAHLLLHFSPLSLPPVSLLSLPFASTLPSLSHSKRLTVTSAHPETLSINNVKISDFPIFDDGFLIVYAIDGFFNLNFTLTSTNSTGATTTNPKSDLQCLNLETISRFQVASGVLKSRGYSIMASFLDLQLLGFSENFMQWTVFAPVDEELVPFSGDFPRYYSLFMRHLVPCKAGWRDLDETANGTVISNNAMGFGLEITKDEDDEVLMVNGVEITFPDMFVSEWLVVHGIRRAIALPESEEEELEFVDVSPGDKFDELVPPEF